MAQQGVQFSQGDAAFSLSGVDGPASFSGKNYRRRSARALLGLTGLVEVVDKTDDMRLFI
jgi:hypothetical protein